MFVGYDNFFRNKDIINNGITIKIVWAIKPFDAITQVLQHYLYIYIYIYIYHDEATHQRFSSAYISHTTHCGIVLV